MVNAVERIRFEHVGKRFTTPARGEVWALRDVSLSCVDGELTCVLGPSGCGKTTLLRLAAGLESPTEGRVLVNGRVVDDPPGDIGVVSQEGSLLPWRRVLGNVVLGLELRGAARGRRKRQARAMLERVRLPASVARSWPHELSGGMRQRVALARALCVDPKLLLMDEPFGALDERTRHHLQDDLLGLWAHESRTIIFVTHNIDEAIFLADRVLVMGEQPSGIVGEKRIDLPRPRERLAPEFAEYHLVLRRMLEEALVG